jgi:hypothetical protein
MMSQQLSMPSLFITNCLIPLLYRLKESPSSWDLIVIYLRCDTLHKCGNNEIA